MFSRYSRAYSGTHSVLYFAASCSQSVLLPVDSGPMTTIFLGGGMLDFFSPGNITHNGKDQKNQVLKTGEDKMFVKIKRDGSQIGNDPPGPVFQFLFIHQPHTGKSSSEVKLSAMGTVLSVKRLSRKYKIIQQTEKKDQTISPVSF